MSVTGFNSIISATLTGETDIICDNLTANTITLPSGDLQTTLDNIVAGTGETGPAGADGQSVSFYAPNITTLSAGSDATVNDVITTVSNTQYHQLTFNIPRGDKGEQGEEGDQGPKGDQGEQGPKGDDGNSTAATAAAAAAAVSAAAAAASAVSSSTSAAASAVSAASAASSAASAEASVSEIGGRVTYIDVGGSYPNGYTTFNRGGGAEGIRMYNDPTDLTYALRIRNNGTITQLAGSNDFLNTNITGTLTVSSTITGNLTGSASQVVANTSVLNSNLPIPFLSNTTGAVNVLTDIVNGITYNPSTNTLTSANFVGDVSGNLTGTATNATNATNATIATDATNASFFPTFVSTTTGNLPLKVDAGITYNPSTNILSCDVSGNLTGTATNATNATKILATNSTTNANYNIPFLSAATGNVDVLTDSIFGMTYNPSTNVLTVEKLEATTLQGSTINVGDATNTSTINIEGNNGCTINIGVAAFLNSINIGNNLSTVTIKCITDTAITVFNPMDQMNGIF